MRMTRYGKGTRYALMIITAPARDKGTASLKRGGDLWNWFPAIERTIKVTPSLLGQSWLGSDFSNDDILRESTLTNDYTHRMAGERMVEGESCYTIELTPKEDAPVAWGKIMLAVGKNGLNIRRMEYFDERGALVSTMNSSSLRAFGDRTVATRMEMVPADKPGFKTVMTIEAAEFDKDIPDSVFSLQSLKTLR